MSQMQLRFARWLVTSGSMPREEVKRLYAKYHKES